MRLLGISTRWLRNHPYEKPCENNTDTEARLSF